MTVKTEQNWPWLDRVFDQILLKVLDDFDISIILWIILKIRVNCDMTQFIHFFDVKVTPRSHCLQGTTILLVKTVILVKTVNTGHDRLIRLRSIPVSFAQNRV